MDRIKFFDSISGIEYPEMIVHFFDHFIALKYLVENNGKVDVIKSTPKSITFNIQFKSTDAMNNAMSIIEGNGNGIMIYNRPLSIKTNILTDNAIEVKLY